MSDATDGSLAMDVPDEHVGAFVAEVFEDPEKDTDWADVVDAMVAPGALDAWAALSAREQVVETLRTASDYDDRAIDAFAAIPLDLDALPEREEERYRDGLRLRRNADVLRDGVAARYASGDLDDETLVEAVEAVEYDTDVVAARENALEAVAEAYDLSFRPYGGTLLERNDGERDEDDFVPF
jgi:hypothetical protein